MIFNTIILNLLVALCLKAGAAWSCHSKCLKPNKTGQTSSAIALDFKQIFPGVFDLDKKLVPVPQLLEGLAEGAVEADSFEQVQKEARETIFHSLNNTLSLILTHHDLIRSAMTQDISLFHQTSLITIQSDEEIVVKSFLEIMRHDVADLCQGFLHLTKLQRLIDSVSLVKKSIFKTGTIASYDHNEAYFAAPIIDAVLEQIEHQPIYKHRERTLLKKFTENNHINYFPFINIEFDFLDNIHASFTKIKSVLPKASLISAIIAEKHLKNKKESPTVLLESKSRELVIIKCNAQTRLVQIQHMFQRTDYILTLLELARDTAMLSADIDHDNEVDVIARETIQKKYNNLVDIPQLNKVFECLKDNIKFLASERKEMGMTDTHYKIFLNAKQSLENALKKWEKSKKPKIIITPVVFPTAQFEEDEIIYNNDYFQNEHIYHQKIKQNMANKTTSIETKLLSPYESQLYLFLKDIIYRPGKLRPTWTEIVDGLFKLGFFGKPNKTGSGSTWEFSVTNKNELFFNDPEYKGATFSVHEYPVHNEPVNAKYIKFFKSGLTHVFGLSENYIDSQLS